jgi:hypothetical protein
MKILINGNLFSIEEVDGPISQGGGTFPVQVCYAAYKIHLLRSLPEEIKKWVLAAAISEACDRSRIPLICPNWIS